MRKINFTNMASHTILFQEEAYKFLSKKVNSENYSKLFVLVDENSNEFALPLFLSKLSTNLEIEIIEIESGEENKNIETCTQIWQILLELNADRKSLLINLGGGVITDLGGFIASTFKRGIDFIHVPTTLLAMVDASLGGKNGIDIGVLKNQIGCVQEPIAIIIDIVFLESLPTNQMCSGLAEMLKHGLIYSKDYWFKFINLSNLNSDNLVDLIKESIDIKYHFVNSDPFEKGIRKALNFGHTIGHAIESYFLEINKPILHGESIAFGMIIESFISYKKELITYEEYLQIKKLIYTYFEPIDITIISFERLNELMLFDKKNEGGKINFVLLNNIGDVKINQIVDEVLIYEAFEDYKK